MTAALVAGCGPSGHHSASKQLGADSGQSPANNAPAAPTGQPTGTPAGGSAGSAADRTSNGIEKLGVSEIIAKTVQAAGQASTVRMRANLVADGETIKFDLRLKAGVGAIGTFMVNRQPVKIIRIGRTVYMRGNAAFWRSVGAGSVGKLVAGKYVKTPATGKDAAQLIQFTDLHTVMKQFFGDADSAGTTKGSTTVIAGHRALSLTGKDASGGGTIYVALTGRPYPLKVTLDAGGNGSGTLEFLDYDKPLHLAAPPASQVLDPTKK